MLLSRMLLIGCLVVVVGGRPAAAKAPAAVDIYLMGGTIVDGTGGEPFESGVAVRDGKIVAVGDVEPAAGARIIDCKGLVIAPGFIDLHNHSDYNILAPEARDARCYLTQGCTTLVTGNCGGGRADVGKYYDDLAEQGVGLNIAQLLPHGALRDQVMGKVRRAPTSAELEKMRTLADAAMRDGAWGVSTGLQYVPGSYANTDELVAISQVIGERGGIYASHIRDEGDELVESVEEVLEIARRAKLPVHISHFKSTKRRNWGKVRVVARLVEQARQQSLRVTADQYPYTASSTSIMAMLLSDEDREGGELAAAERLKDPKEVARLRPQIAQSLAERGQLMIASFSEKPEWIGKMIRDVAQAEGRDEVEIALELFHDPEAQGVNFSMDEADVRYVMSLPWVATASDGSSKIDDGTRPHPRSFGTFPRKIGRYAVQEKVVSLSAAVRSATGLPADILGLSDRGYVRKHLVADIVVFDPQTLEDRATYDRPFETSTGIRWLLVNGEIAIADGVPLEVLAGKPLRRDVGETPVGQP